MSAVVQSIEASPGVGPVLGWVRDQPDFRDYTTDDAALSALLERLPRSRKPHARPRQADLREFFFEPVKRGSLPLATAEACVALAEYFERRAHGKVAVRSPLFLYQVARRLATPSGDPGTGIRTTLKALARFGVPPENHYPSDPDHFRHEPDAFVTALARRFPLVRYFRLDARNGAGEKTLERVQAFLAAGFPAVFGYPVTDSAMVALETADIPYRAATDSVLGGQAAIALGYDDSRLTGSRGALLIYVPLGLIWRRPGYYWLPYRYVEQQLAVDFWTLICDEWIDSEEFDRPVDLVASH